MKKTRKKAHESRKKRGKNEENKEKSPHTMKKVEKWKKPYAKKRCDTPTFFQVFYFLLIMPI